MNRFTLLLTASTACAPVGHTAVTAPTPGVAPLEAVGVLVMAHGGGEEWNRHVGMAVEPLAREVPTAVAYGMADPHTLRAALDSLRNSGVGRVAVVRMFLSGASFFDQTNYLLGMSEVPPETFVLMGPAASDPAARNPIATGVVVATHTDGLLVSKEAQNITVERAHALSSRPSRESVLILAHGMRDEDENERVLVAMQSIAQVIGLSGFANVEVATLREDWPLERAAAETEVRSFVSREASAGRRVIVLPMRLSGFGPYADVLARLDYVPGTGLLPHDAVADWVRSTASRVACSAGWGPVIGPCSTVGG